MALFAAASTPGDLILELAPCEKIQIRLLPGNPAKKGEWNAETAH
jgi:hypothetical protein